MSRKLFKGIYIHRKTGRFYRLIGKAWSVHKPKESLVVYSQLSNSPDGKYPMGTIWTRTTKSFDERDSKGKFRFSYSFDERNNKEEFRFSYSFEERNK